MTVVGSGAGIPTARRGSPCLLVEAEGVRAALDIGSGSLRALALLGVEPRSLDLVVVTHFHPDHAADLAPLLFALRNPDYPRGGTLELLGPQGTKEHLAALGRLWDGKLEPRGYELRSAELRDGSLRHGPWRLSFAPTGHTAASVACAVEAGGRRLAYGGDSPASAELVALAAGADLLVLECSFPDASPHPRHLTPTAAGTLAAAAGARRLVLTHFYPAVDPHDAAQAARSVFPGEVIAAEDGLELEV